MKKDITVHVEQKDIRGARRYDPRFCPLANAVSRTTGKFAYVDYDEVTLTNLLRGPRYKPSRRANKFIDDFDNGRRVHPSTFVLHPIRRGKA